VTINSHVGIVQGDILRHLAYIARLGELEKFALDEITILTAIRDIQEEFIYNLVQKTISSYLPPCYLRYLLQYFLILSFHILSSWKTGKDAKTDRLDKFREHSLRMTNKVK
jgi:hypothetical protein